MGAPVMPDIVCCAGVLGVAGRGQSMRTGMGSGLTTAAVRPAAIAAAIRTAWSAVEGIAARNESCESASVKVYIVPSEVKVRIQAANRRWPDGVSCDYREMTVG